MTNTCMTMKLIDILNEGMWIKKEIKSLTGVKIPFEYGTVMFDHMTYETDEEVVMIINITLNKFEPDMFNKAYLAFSQKIQSLYSEQHDMSNIKLNCKEVWLQISDLSINLSNYLSVSTKNTLRYDKPSVEKILKGDYHVEVNMDLLPNITDDTYDIVEKRKEHGRMIFEFLQDGTLSNGVSYKLNPPTYITQGLNYVEKDGRHIDYRDIIILMETSPDKDYPLTNDEKKEITKMFMTYDVDIHIR